MLAKAAFDEACRQFRETGTVDPDVRERALDFITTKYLADCAADGIGPEEAMERIRECALKEAKAKPVVSLASVRKLSPRRAGSAS